MKKQNRIVLVALIAVLGLSYFSLRQGNAVLATNVEKTHAEAAP